MSRSNYSYDCDHLELYRHAVDCALKGRRGQAFLREMAVALDAMPVKELIAGDLVRNDGAVCAIGAVCQARQLDVSHVDSESPWRVGRLVGIAESMAAEIAFENDEHGPDYSPFSPRGLIESPTKRWQRMRAWVAEQIGGEKV